MATEQYTKGPMGFWIECRKAMGELSVASREWCRAFDAGDMQAITDVGKILAEAMRDVGAAVEGAEKAQKGSDDGA